MRSGQDDKKTKSEGKPFSDLNLELRMIILYSGGFLKRVLKDEKNKAHEELPLGIIWVSTATGNK